MKIYSNKEFSQLAEFSTKRTSSTRQFQKICTKVQEDLETKSKGVEQSEQSELGGRAARHLGRPTRARDKRAVTIPTV